MDADQDYNIFEDCGEPPLPKMMSLPEQVKHLENSNSNLHVMLDTLTQENDTILKNALEAEATIGEANLMIMDMHNENCDLNNRIEDAEKRSAFNKIKISDLEKSLSEEKEAHQKLKNLLDSTIESFQKAEQKCEKYKALVDAGDENLQEVCARVVQARFEKQELETKLDRLNKREVMFLKQISNLKTQSLKFKEELSKEKEESSNLRDLLKKEKEEREVAELMEKSTTLQVELSKIDDDKWKDKMKKTLKKVTEEADMNKKEAEKNKKEAELLKKKMSEFNQDNEKLNKKVAQQISLLEKRNISLQASNDNLLLELKDLINKSKKDEINKEEIESYKIKIKEDIDMIIALEKHNISLQDTTENLFKEIENLSKINESFKKNSEEVELYKMKSKEDSDLISEISLKLQQSEENGVVMNDSVAKLQEQVASKELKIKEEISKFEDMKKLHQQTMTKLNEEQIKVKSFVELQDSLRISNEKCIKLSAEVEVQQNVINSQVSLITNLETKLQGVEHRAYVAEVKHAEVTAQLEKTKLCHAEELQKLKETITSNKSQLVEYQERISTLETLKEERKKQDEIESELNTEKAVKNSNELLAIKNVLNNIQVDFESQELKLKEKELILQQNNIFISGLTKELQELRSKISQQYYQQRSGWPSGLQNQGCLKPGDLYYPPTLLVYPCHPPPIYIHGGYSPSYPYPTEGYTPGYPSYAAINTATANFPAPPNLGVRAAFPLLQSSSTGSVALRLPSSNITYGRPALLEGPQETEAKAQEVQVCQPAKENKYQYTCDLNVAARGDDPMSTGDIIDAKKPLCLKQEKPPFRNPNKPRSSVVKAKTTPVIPYTLSVGQHYSHSHGPIFLRHQHKTQQGEITSQGPCQTLTVSNTRPDKKTCSDTDAARDCVLGANEVQNVSVPPGFLPRYVSDSCLMEESEDALGLTEQEVPVSQPDEDNKSTHTCLNKAARGNKNERDDPARKYENFEKKPTREMQADAPRSERPVQQKRYWGNSARLQKSDTRNKGTQSKTSLEHTPGSHGDHGRYGGQPQRIVWPMLGLRGGAPPIQSQSTSDPARVQEEEIAPEWRGLLQELTGSTPTTAVELFTNVKAIIEKKFPTLANTITDEMIKKVWCSEYGIEIINKLCRDKCESVVYPSHKLMKIQNNFLLKLGLNNGFDVNEIDELGNTLLHKAILEDDIIVFMMLLLNNADCNTRNLDGESQRHICSRLVNDADHPNAKYLLRYLHQHGASRCETIDVACTNGCKANSEYNGIEKEIDPETQWPDHFQELIATNIKNIPKRMMGPVLLSMDGGGTKGVIEVQILLDMFTMVQYKPSQVVDYICGSSAGGLIAVGLGLENSLRMVESTFFMFTKSGFAGKPEDNSNALQKLLCTFLEHKRLSDVKNVKLMVPAVDASLTAPKMVVFENNVDNADETSNISLSKVALKTSAALTYLVANGEHVDAGFLANNPTQVAYNTIYMKTGLTPHVLSIGAGIEPCKPQDVNALSLTTPLIHFSNWLSYSPFSDFLLTCLTDTDGVPVVSSNITAQREKKTFIRMTPRVNEKVKLNCSDINVLIKLQFEARLYFLNNKSVFQSLAIMLNRRGREKSRNQGNREEED